RVVSEYSEAEAAIAAIVQDLVRTVDQSTLKRLLEGDVALALVERNDVAVAISGLPISAAYDVLNQRTYTAAKLKKYFAPPPVVWGKNPPAGAKAAVIAAILQDAYGQAYTPPPKPTKPTNPKTTKPK